MPERDWTLLVQGVDLWVPEFGTAAQFAFLPPWRLDDVMINTTRRQCWSAFRQYDGASVAKDDGRWLNARGKRR